MNKTHIKTILILFIVMLFMFFLVDSNKKNLLYNEEEKKIFKIAIIFNQTGLGDKSFNDLCYEGMLQAQEKLGIEFDYIHVKNNEDYDDAYLNYAKDDTYDLIIGLGEEQEDSIKKIAKEYPKQRFTVIDSKLSLPNVSSIYTKWNEQTFLNGVLAGLCTTEAKQENDSVGVILGKNLSYLEEGAIGFEAGVKYINPNINVIKATVGDFDNPAKAKEIGLLMYKKGVNYIQQLAGQSGFGVFAAAKEMNKYVFGVDANQNIYEPDYIVSTATRYADMIIYNEIESLVNDKWVAGTKELGLVDDVIGYEREGSNVKITSNIIKKVEEIKKLIINGKIIIPSTQDELDVYLNNKK
ncbi:MAG: BMP family ABC transporter substrate-binding protein [Terrisporobacter othiniensis]|uniref:BMP family ABC transporter substrate-binding protein n=2 Tax=Terrisporobacter TaxID=1505652 RepID=A0AAX2ZJG0_9FIRM|nr:MULTISPECIES: BMP family ABC transporter substrate-binding protein [Terrisporobacter]MBN9647334.1 BMP family ABC transporter substrate-binding protein [Terrisporobacter glycolicus]MDU4860432.1 BMP family ABC transporter substrate-binding protein [Terrisporobacter othiniensis]MDU6993339.1 BMP family ABC transporter substrate-binding protein [Terrisporobacter othiniensis]UEL48495.1 BMP family ABC transporter substrate-binding protein [Terrisporobacter hibernicus]HBI93174.1 BMP family ABC tran